MDHGDLVSLRQRHPGWGLLQATSAPFVATVLHRVFVAGNARTVSQPVLVEAVDDERYRLRQFDPEAFPREPKEYVADWASVDKGWLRTFYPPGSDVPSYDLTPAAEKALTWLDSLAQRTFVGTESRLLTLFQLLEQIVEGSQENPAERLAALHRRRAEIDAEIARVESGELRVLDDTAVRDRFQQFSATAHGLLADFREVEENFRALDRGVRESIASWDGPRGALLDEILGEREAIASSDQGVSFQAFWDFLMAADRQGDFERLLEATLALPSLDSADPSLRYVVGDWLRAADSVQVTVAQLSHQLRRFLDDRAYLENRRIAEILRSVESRALQVRDRPPAGAFAEIDEARADVAVPMARRMYEPAPRITLDDGPVEAGDDDVPDAALFEQFVVDARRLHDAVSTTLATRDQATLAQVLADHPVEQGLAEVVSYLALADADTAATFDPDRTERVDWGPAEERRTAEVPMVVFTREATDRG